MAHAQQFQELKNILTTAVAACGFELWGCELLQQQHQQLLRVFIESEEGITVDDCAKASRQISAVFDVEEPIAGAYLLEVSSPGLDRPLFSLAQYQQYIGKKIQLKLQRPLSGRRNFSGTLTQADKENIQLVDAEQQTHTLPFEQIEKARLIPEF